MKISAEEIVEVFGWDPVEKCMDPEILSDIHMELGHCTPSELLYVYSYEYFRRYGRVFEVKM